MAKIITEERIVTSCITCPYSSPTTDDHFWGLKCYKMHLEFTNKFVKENKLYDEIYSKCVLDDVTSSKSKPMSSNNLSWKIIDVYE